MAEKPLADKIALVTGASRGIGAAAALLLAQAGAHIVAVARTVGGLEELDDKIKAAGGTATLVPLDMKDSDGIARLALALNERYQRLDVLVGNAGVLGPLSPLDHYQPEDWDDLMAVNVTANWQLIRCMDVLLQRSHAGRAVFLTSGVAHYARPYWGPYAASKAALGRDGPHLRGGMREHQCARQSVRARPDPHAHVSSALSPASIRKHCRRPSKSPKPSCHYASRHAARTASFTISVRKSSWSSTNPHRTVEHGAAVR